MNAPNFRKIDLVTYKPGRSLLSSKKKVIKLSANESAFGAGERVKNILKNRKSNISKYPDSKFKKLIETISKKFNLNKEKIICGAGSDEIIQMICTLFLNKGDEVVVPQYSFLMYRIYAKIVGAKVNFSKEVNFKVSVGEILKKVGKNTKIVFIANPNNPTGTYLTKKELLKLRKKLNKKILLVVDDAYFEYMMNKDYSPGLNIFKNSSNVFILRTFSKIHGLAALRVGWGYGDKKIIKKVTKKTKIVFLANPNNPTGTYLTKLELIELRKKLRKNILLVVDDAYTEYMKNSDYKSGLEIGRAHV